MLRPLLLTALATLALTAAPAAPTDGGGFLHGTLTLENGETHTGFLRWDDEEACWNDLFHSRQQQLPWFDAIDLEELAGQRRQRYNETHGLLDRILFTLTKEDQEPPSRLFVQRFGDLRTIEISGRRGAIVTTRDGEVYEVAGYANDVGGEIVLLSAGAEPREFDWDDLVRIEFSAPPADAAAPAERLYGTVSTDRGDFTGHILWDESESVFTDILDGEADGQDQEIPMGTIAAIERRDDRSCDVTLRDGRVLLMSGSNDVNEDIRGIQIHVPELGRVDVPWKRFRRADFHPAPGSGPGYGDFAATRPLVGTVTAADGRRLTGRLVLDLDEAWTRDLLDGEEGDIIYAVPLGLVARLEPAADGGSCRVRLRGGRELVLTGDQDCGRGNAGVLVFAADGGEPAYLPWSEVRGIDLDP